MAKKSKKKLSFRQRLREAAKVELDTLLVKVTVTVGDIAIEHGLRPEDLAKLMSGGQTKTLKEGMVTALANRKEAELEAIYNTQAELLPEDDNADKKEV